MRFFFEKDIDDIALLWATDSAGSTLRTFTMWRSISFTTCFWPEFGRGGMYVGLARFEALDVLGPRLLTIFSALYPVGDSECRGNLQEICGVLTRRGFMLRGRPSGE